MIEINKLCEAKRYLLDYSVVIFDLDDTLYSEKDYVKSGYADIACHYKTIASMEDKLWNAFENNEQAINYVLKQEGLFSYEAVNHCLEIYRNHFPRISLYPDAKDLLVFLKEHKIRLGMITDGRPEGQRAKIKALKIEQYFDKLIITDELGGAEFRKPNPIAFEKMHAFFNIPYEAMVYVGDNTKKDFIAPKSLGMGCVYFNNPDGLYSAKRFK